MGKAWLRPGLVMVGLAIAACQSATPAPVTVSGGISATVVDRATGLTLSVGVNTRSLYRILQQGFTEADVSHLRVVLTPTSPSGAAQVLDPVTKAPGSAEFSFNLSNLRYNTAYTLLIEAKTFQGGTAVTIGQTSDTTIQTGVDAEQTLYRSYTIALGDREFSGQAPVGIGFTPGAGIATPAAPAAIKTPYAQGFSVTTVAGSTQGYADGTGAAAKFNTPHGVAADGSGRVYVTDTQNHCIRRIESDGSVSVFAGMPQVSGVADGPANVARFNEPVAVVLDRIGNLYVSDLVNRRICKITPMGMVTTLAGGTYGSNDGTGSAASFSNIAGLCLDSQGNLIVADDYNHRIRKVTPAGVVTTIAGSSQGFLDGNGTSAQFSYPRSVAVDGSGNIYVADNGNNRIRLINPSGNVSTFAGNGAVTTTDGPALLASFTYPSSVVRDPFGTLYVLEYTKLRRISPAGTVSTVAGSGAQTWVDGVGTAAAFHTPFSLALAPNGHLYVADTSNHRIRRIQ